MKTNSRAKLAIMNHPAMQSFVHMTVTLVITFLLLCNVLSVIVSVEAAEAKTLFKDDGVNEAIIPISMEKSFEQSVNVPEENNFVKIADVMQRPLNSVSSHDDFVHYGAIERVEGHTLNHNEAAFENSVDVLNVTRTAKEMDIITLMESPAHKIVKMGDVKAGQLAIVRVDESPKDTSQAVVQTSSSAITDGPEPFDPSPGTQDFIDFVAFVDNNHDGVITAEEMTLFYEYISYLVGNGIDGHFALGVAQAIQENFSGLATLFQQASSIDMVEGTSYYHLFYTAWQNGLLACNRCAVWGEAGPTTLSPEFFNGYFQGNITVSDIYSPIPEVVTSIPSLLDDTENMIDSDTKKRKRNTGASAANEAFVKSDYSGRGDEDLSLSAQDSKLLDTLGAKELSPEVLASLTPAAGGKTPVVDVPNIEAGMSFLNSSVR